MGAPLPGVRGRRTPLPLDTCTLGTGRGRKFRRVERSGTGRVALSSWTGSRRERPGAGGAPGWRGGSSDRSGVAAGVGAPAGPQALAPGGVASGQSRAGQGSCGMPGSRFEEHSWTRRTVNRTLLSDKGRTGGAAGGTVPNWSALPSGRAGVQSAGSHPAARGRDSESMPMAKGPDGRCTGCRWAVGPYAVSTCCRTAAAPSPTARRRPPARGGGLPSAPSSLPPSSTAPGVRGNGPGSNCREGTKGRSRRTRVRRLRPPRPKG